MVRAGQSFLHILLFACLLSLHSSLYAGTGSLIVEIGSKGKLARHTLNELKKSYRLRSVTPIPDGQRMELHPLSSRKSSALPVLGNKRNEIITISRQYTVDGKPVIARTVVNSQRVWQREHIRITIEVLSKEKYFSISADREKIPGFLVLQSPVLKTTARIQGKLYYSRKMSWHLNALVDGMNTIELPAVRYNSGGRIKQLVRLPRIRFLVKRLPRYIPPLMPIGKISIHASVNRSIIHPGSLGFLEIVLTSPGIRAHQLPGILKYLAGDNRLSFLPAEIRKQNRSTISHINGTITYQVPFKTKRSGRTRLPQIELQYFDPDTGIIRQHRASFPAVYGLAWYWRVMAMAFMLWLLVFISKATWRQVRHYRAYRKHLEQAVHLLTARKDWRAIRKALAAVASAEGWNGNISLTEWQHRYQQRHGHDHDLVQALSEFSRTIYAGRKTDLEATASSLAAIIVSHRYNFFTCPRKPALDISTQ